MEDTIHKRLRKLAILLETCQDELATLTNELSDVSIAKNQASSLTQQFMAMSLQHADVKTAWAVFYSI